MNFDYYGVCVFAKADKVLQCFTLLSITGKKFQLLNLINKRLLLFYIFIKAKAIYLKIIQFIVDMLQIAAKWVASHGLSEQICCTNLRWKLVLSFCTTSKTAQIGKIISKSRKQQIYSRKSGAIPSLYFLLIQFVTWMKSHTLQISSSRGCSILIISQHCYCQEMICRNQNTN